MPNKSVIQFAAYSLDEKSLTRLEKLLLEAQTESKEQLKQKIYGDYEDRINDVRSSYADDDKYCKQRICELEKRRYDDLSSNVSEKTKMTYTISLADGTRDLQRSSIYTMLDMPNRSKQKLSAIQAQVGDYRFLSIKLELSTGNEFMFITNISYHIHGSEQELLFYSAKLDDWIVGLRPWFWRLYFAVRNPPIWLIYMALILSVSYGIEFAILNTAVSHDYKINHSEIIGAVFGVAGVSLAILINKSIRMLLPVSEFSIGDGVRRKKQRENILKFIFGPVAIALLIGILSSVIGNMLTTLSKST